MVWTYLHGQYVFDIRACCYSICPREVFTQICITQH